MDLNWALLAPILIIQMILMVTALIDAIRNETNGPKVAWILLIVFISMLGPIIYFIFGRKK